MTNFFRENGKVCQTLIGKSSHARKMKKVKDKYDFGAEKME